MSFKVARRVVWVWRRVWEDEREARRDVMRTVRSESSGWSSGFGFGLKELGREEVGADGDDIVKGEFTL